MGSGWDDRTCVLIELFFFGLISFPLSARDDALRNGRALQLLMMD